MQEAIAGLERFTFAFEKDVELQRGTGLQPFEGMDSEWGGPAAPPLLGLSLPFLLDSFFHTEKLEGGHLSCRLQSRWMQY